MDSPPLLDARAHRFRPAHPGTIWPRFLRGVAEIVLRRACSVQSIRLQCGDRVRASLAADRPVLVASNSNKYFDPIVYAYVSGLVGPPFHYMAAVTDFEGDAGMDGWVMQHAGAFSVDRGVADRPALREAVTLLVDGRRPLVMFPESIARFDGRRIFPLVGGVAYIALAAGRQRAAAAGRPAPVIHPTVVRYHYRPGLERHLPGWLERLERRVRLAPAPDLSVPSRLVRIGTAALDEIGADRSGVNGAVAGGDHAGDWAARVGRLMEDRLRSLEAELGVRAVPEHQLERIRRLHKAIAESRPGANGDGARQRQIRELEQALRLLRHLSESDVDYCTGDRAAEAVERLMDDLCSETVAAGPMDVVVRFGEALPTEAGGARLRSRDAEADLLARLRAALQAELDIVAAQSAPAGRRVL